MILAAIVAPFKTGGVYGRSVTRDAHFKQGAVVEIIGTEMMHSWFELWDRTSQNPRDWKRTGRELRATQMGVKCRLITKQPVEQRRTMLIEPQFLRICNERMEIEDFESWIVADQHIKQD